MFQWWLLEISLLWDLVVFQCNTQIILSLSSVINKNIFHLSSVEKPLVLLPEVGLLSEFELRFLKISACSTLAEAATSKSRRNNYARERIHQRSEWNISHRWLIARDGQTLCCFEVLWTFRTVLLVLQGLWTVPSSILSLSTCCFSGWEFCWCIFI